ncbi:MAG: class IV adenylate cyclase [Candidatus Thorarchaeota archaeon]
MVIITEIEIKIPLVGENSDIGRIKSQIFAKFGTPKDRMHQIDTYFQSPIVNFHQTDEALRIRQIQENETQEIELTYKGPKKGNEMKIREEITLRVSDAETAHILLTLLGFQEVMRVKKHRINWVLSEGVQVSLDRVEGLGDFLEIELLETDLLEDLDLGKRRIRQVANAIFPKWDGTEERRSYLELLLTVNQDDNL